MASISCTNELSSGIPLGESWVSEPGGRSYVPGSREFSFQDSLGRGMLEYLLRCHYFERVKLTT